MHRAFIYLGKDERIAQDYERFGEAIDEAYQKLLGGRRYARLREVNAQVLTPNSYFEDASELKKLGLDIGSSPCSKFIIAAPDLEKCLPNGHDGVKEVKIAPAFYVSNESFKHSGARQFTDHPIGTYVHEFNHYLSFALQRVPIYMMTVMLSEKVGRQLRGADQIAEFFEGVSIDASPITEKQKRIGYALLQTIFDYSYEQMNNLLDRDIFKAIGAKIKTEWRGQPKQYFAGRNPKLGTFAFPVGGDFFYGMNDAEAFSKFLNWEEHFTFKGVGIGEGSNDLLTGIRNSLDSVLRINVQKITLDEMIKEDGNEHS